MIFFPDKVLYEKPADYGLSFEDVFLTVSEKVILHGWYLKAAPAKAVILYLHGNAGNISARLGKARGWVQRGISVLLLDYRGYGRSTGEIRRGEEIVLDARAALEWLRTEKKFSNARIILYGESLGSYPAVRLAAEDKFAGLILEAPYTSFVELARKHYGLLPTALSEHLLKDFAFRNIDIIDTIRSPLFIIHGTLDEICDYAMSGELIDKAPGNKAFFSVPNGHHNDLPLAAGEDFWNKPFEFVSRHLPSHG